MCMSIVFVFSSVCVCVFEYLCVRFSYLISFIKLQKLSFVSETTMRACVFLLLHAFYCLVIVVGLYCTALLCVVTVVVVTVAVVGQS